MCLKRLVVLALASHTRADCAYPRYNQAECLLIWGKSNLPKHYKAETDDGPDFIVTYYNFDSRDSAEGYIGFAGEYGGMSAQRTEVDRGEKFVESIRDTLPNGYVKEWDIYRSRNGWSMKTSGRLYSWAYGPTRESLMRWKEILKTKEYGP